MAAWRRVASVEDEMRRYDREMASELERLRAWLRTQLHTPDDATVEACVAKAAGPIAEARRRHEERIAIGLARSEVHH